MGLPGRVGRAGPSRHRVALDFWPESGPTIGQTQRHRLAPRGARRGNARAGEVAAGDVGLDQAGRRGARRRFDAEVIDLGNEPPLLVDGGSGGLLDRRRLSVQWFSGTILTGLCGAALMGGAVFASLDGETNFATAPERVEMALRGAIAGIGDRLNAFRKADRLPAIAEQSVTRQILKIPTSTRVREPNLPVPPERWLSHYTGRSKTLIRDKEVVPRRE